MFCTLDVANTGKLIDNSPDVDCGDLFCMNPTWDNNTIPMDVVNEVTGDGGCIKNTSYHSEGHCYCPS